MRKTELERSVEENGWQYCPHCDFIYWGYTIGDLKVRKGYETRCIGCEKWYFVPESGEKSTKKKKNSIKS